MNLYNISVKRSIHKKLSRTGKIPCDICKEQHLLHEHHIRGRKIPNPNHPSNLCYICANCHQKVHENHIIIEDWVQTTMGKELMWHEPQQESFTGKNAKTYIIKGKK